MLESGEEEGGGLEGVLKVMVMGRTGRGSGLACFVAQDLLDSPAPNPTRHASEMEL